MKRLLALLLAGALLLSGCAVHWEDEAAPAEKIDKSEQSDKAEKEEPSKEQAPADEKKEPSKDQEQDNAKDDPPIEQPQASAKTLGELYETGWEPGAAYLYGESAYYCIERDEEAYIYSLKLGAGNQPGFLSAGELMGQYGSALFKEERGRISALDLSAPNGIWKELCKEGEDSLWLSAGEKLLILSEGEEASTLQIIDLNSLAVEGKELPYEVEKAVFQDGTLYFSEEEDDRFNFYQWDLKASALKELHRVKEGFDWEIIGERALFHKSGAQPYILNLETGETDSFHAFELETLFGGMNEELIRPRLARFFEGIAYFEMTNGNYWAYDIAKNQGEEIKEIPDVDRSPLRNGGSFSGGGSAADHTFRVFLDGKEYTAHQNLYSHLYLQDANGIGAIVTHASRIFACRWDEGEHFESYLIADHPLI